VSFPVHPDGTELGRAWIVAEQHCQRVAAGAVTLHE
jgi:hypothetical protein